MTTDAIRQALSSADPLEISLEERHEMIAVGAYFLAERRSFVPGRELQDWLQAAAAIDRMLARMRSLGIARRGLDASDLRNALCLLADGASSSDAPRIG